MPGIPTSRGCRICKARRIKCDEKWPTCSACKRKGTSCPGPTSLVKFIHADYDGDEKGAQANPESGSPNESPPSIASTHRNGRVLIARRRSNMHPICNWYRYPDIQPRIISNADSTAARLVQHIQMAPDRGMVFQMKYLNHLPKRLDESPSLQASVNLFCAVWDAYCRGENAGDFRGMPAYNNAIGRLGRLLGEGESACSASTLASITILGRTEYLFGSGNETQPLVHELGITSLNAALGPPRPGDELHTSLLCENFVLLVPYWIMTGEQNYMAQSPWKEMTVKAMAESVVDARLHPHICHAFDIVSSLCFKTSAFLQGCWTLQSSTQQHSPEMRELAEKLIKDLQQEELLDAALADLFLTAVELGAILKMADPKSITGTSYKIAEVALAQVLLAALSVQLHVLKMRYDCSVLYPYLSDPATLWDRFESLCHHVWNFIPFLLSLESFVAVTSQTVLYPTLEVANEAQKTYILGALSELDEYRQVLPKDRGALERMILSNAKLLTGRIPIPQEAKQGGACDASFSRRGSV